AVCSPDLPSRPPTHCSFLLPPTSPQAWWIVWPVWLARGPSCDSTRREILVEGPIQRRFVVRALGRQLHLRNQRRAARTGNGFPDGARLLPARGGLAAHRAEGRRQLW